MFRILLIILPIIFILFAIYIFFRENKKDKLKKQRHIKDQINAVDDVSTRLQNLKKEFDNGSLTEQEYEDRRKRLFYKL